MRLRNILFLASGIAGIGLIAYSGIWYLNINHDPSQFIAFALLGAFLTGTSIVANELFRKIEHFAGEINYFEEQLLDKFPELKGEEKNEDKTENND